MCVTRNGKVLLMRIPKDQLEIYFEYGADIMNRCLFLIGDIDEERIGCVIKGLYFMENQTERYEPIELRISSDGGDIYDMMALHDVTRTLRSPVHTMGVGKVMSSAVLLLACGEKGNRWAGPNTSFMVHVPSWDAKNDSMHSHKIAVDEVSRLWNNWYKLMAQYTNKDSGFWKRLCNKKEDVYFDAYQAQEWGVIDHIWDEKGGED